MKYVRAFTPCLNNRKGQWQARQAPDGELFGCYNKNSLFMPFHPMWSGGNHYDTNCLTSEELNEFERYCELAGLPAPMAGEPFDAYQMDFWSAGVSYMDDDDDYVDGGNTL